MGGQDQHLRDQHYSMTDFESCQRCCQVIASAEDVHPAHVQKLPVAEEPLEYLFNVKCVISLSYKQ